MNAKKKFGNRVKQLRRRKNLTQVAFANKICVTQKTVHHWESGKSLCSTEALMKMCEAFKVKWTHFDPYKKWR